MARLFRGSLNDDSNAVTDENSVPSWAINGVFRHFPTLRLPADEMESLQETADLDEADRESQGCDVK